MLLYKEKYTKKKYFLFSVFYFYSFRDLVIISRRYCLYIKQILENHIFTLINQLILFFIYFHTQKYY